MTKRMQIITAADKLFYEQGFEHTSFAHIAKAVNISRGNFYYHFKTKDDILDAVISARLTNTQEMVDNWQESATDPVERIRRFIHILIMNKNKIMQFGCPVGTLTSELNKLDHPAQGSANNLFTVFRTWLSGQFEQLGFSNASDELAMHLLARSQGIATLASAFNDEAFIQNEVSQLNHWLDTQIENLNH
ncbi:TetR/AcrR family transcriptional regulator [uncultured Vibrio sp.]|uniref:TetR/AcrR family transcriptional regulator n=1 Tax=uncultured Vibrio sp. TaxID=114054 RepID=UPI0025CFCC1A|nr:TetR/AcrR family transcriptional regulator [uncultured Vibrio sp.]